MHVDADVVRARGREYRSAASGFARARCLRRLARSDTLRRALAPCRADPLHRLPNGLGVLLCPSDLAPVVELQVWAQVGSADEGPGEHGVAHFHEHMLFKGTARRGVGEVAGAIEGAGGRINAYTSHDVTVYHVTLPAEELALGVDVLADAVLHPSSIRPRSAARSTSCSRRSAAARTRRAACSATRVFAEAFRVHPYRAPILGTPASVSAFERDLLRAFHARWYAPENLVVVAVGSFEPRALLAEIEAGLRRRAPGERAPRQRTREPPQRELRAARADASLRARQRRRSSGPRSASRTRTRRYSISPPT